MEPTIARPQTFGAELKSVKYYAGLSEETNCFTASLWINGKRVATLKNDGQGGETYCRQIFDAEAVHNLEEQIKTLPEVHTMMSGRPFSFKMDFDCFVGDLLTDFLIRKDLKQIMKTKVLFRTHGPNDQILEIRKGRHSDEKIRAHISRQHPNATILNDLTFDEALAHFGEF